MINRHTFKTIAQSEAEGAGEPSEATKAFLELPNP
jgi:hypothetical protein